MLNSVAHFGFADESSRSFGLLIHRLQMEAEEHSNRAGFPCEYYFSRTEETATFAPGPTLASQSIFEPIADGISMCAGIRLLDTPIDVLRSMHYEHLGSISMLPSRIPEIASRFNLQLAISYG